MRIFIDAYQAADKITGTDRLARNMLRELQRLDQSNHYIVATNARFDFVSNSVEASNFELLPLRIIKRATWLMTGLPWLLFTKKADVFLSFHNLSGPGIAVCPSVVFLLDTIPVSRPELYFDKDSWLRRSVVLFTMRRAVGTAKRFAAISNFTKQTAVSDLHIKPDQIKVIYLQADPVFFVPAPDKKLESVRQKYDLPSKFIFAIGSSEPRKNVQALVRAHKLLPDSLRAEYPLRVAGARWHSRDVEIADDPYVAMTGFIADEDLPAAYQMADLFVFPSKYEGFGLPVLEAMASGTPVVTTTATSLPEVAGDAAVLVDADDESALKSALEDLLTHPEKRVKLAEAGRKQVQNFSWGKAAAEVIKLVEEARS